MGKNVRNTLALATTIGALVSLSACTHLLPRPSVGATVVDNEGLADRLQPLINASYRGARVYAPATCRTEGGVPLLTFSKFALRPVSPGVTGIEAVRQMMPQRAVVDNRSGVLSIRLGDAPDQLLRTEIRTLTFSEEEQATDVMAIMAIEENADVQAAMRRLGYRMPLEDVSILPSRPEPGRPFLPRTLSKLTMDEALDKVATTFRGIVFVAVCEQERFYSTDAKGGYDWRSTASSKSKR